MKMLSKDSFNKASKFIKEHGRLLEKAIYEYHFCNGSSEEILNELKKYQNDDGGFGNGLESDFKLPYSSPMATSIAFQHLIKLSDEEKAIDLIRSGIKYFENTFHEERMGWFSVSKEVNDFPHAPWWNYDEKKNMTIIDNSWGNPTAEIIGYLYKYRDLVSKFNVEEFLDFAFNHLNKMDKFPSEHEIYCYLRLYELLPRELSEKIKDKLTIAVKELVCCKREEWDKYVPQPLNFVKSKKSSKFGISDESIEENLDYLIDVIETNGKINPSWEWGNYQLDWEKAKKEWTGVLTLNSLITLDRFNRIERR